MGGGERTNDWDPLLLEKGPGRDIIGFRVRRRTERKVVDLLRQVRGHGCQDVSVRVKNLWVSRGWSVRCLEVKEG